MNGPRKHRLTIFENNIQTCSRDCYLFQVQKYIDYIRNNKLCKVNFEQSNGQIIIYLYGNQSVLNNIKFPWCATMKDFLEYELYPFDQLR